MVILRDEARIARLRRMSKYLSFTGMAALLVGLVLVFTGVENAFLYQLIALAVGWLLSQVGIYLAHRYLRSPRPDEVLDEALKGVARNGRLYHYMLPAPHVLLLPTGVVILVAKWQGGNISVDGDKWRQKGLGLRKFFGQEQLGNPTKEAEIMVEAMANYIRKHAPEVEELPIATLIVFTSKGARELDLKRSRIPAMHYTKVKGYLRQKKRPEPMAPADYEAVRAAFDKRAAHLIESEVS